MGEYGLSDAIAEIKDLKRDLDVRDKHVERLIQELNVLDMSISEAADENEELRYINYNDTSFVLIRK